MDIDAARTTVPAQLEEYLRGQPGLQSSLADAQAQAGRSVVLWLVAIVGLALLVYQFLIRR